ncbi:hypothetical protein SpCBS45565_g01360 [Spizellomyces sp. 'palustris']|nr:hypothetical protein SpCBS45565_g01360 [Spizellomyces sp. 'palustris']
MPSRLLPGQKLFFPNIVFRLLRSNLPPHQCIFRCPPQLNKIDITSYLQNLYNITVTDVRTMNYMGRTYKARYGGRERTANYKKVIISMEEDFNFPPPPPTKLGASVEGDAAIKLPPRGSFGRNSANKYRHKIEEGRPKGVGGPVRKAMEAAKAAKEATKEIA